MKQWIYIIFLIILSTAVAAIDFTSKANIDMQNRYNFINTINPLECMLTNSFITQYGYINATCRTLNYTAIIGYTYPSLAGVGNALLCVNSAGTIYRGNATGCP